MKKRATAPLRHARRYSPAVAAAFDHLESLGVDPSSIELRANKHFRVSWPHKDRRLSVPVSCTPRDMESCSNMVRQAINRAIRMADLGAR